MYFVLPLQFIVNTLAGFGFLVYWVVAFVILYHLSRFGVGTQPKKFAAIFLFGSVILSAAAIIFYMNIDLGSLIGSVSRQTP